MSKINLIIERSRFAAGQYDINLANEAEREVAAMHARIKALETENSVMYAAILEASNLGTNSAMQARIEKLEDVARVAGFIELNRHNYLFNGRLEADKVSMYYMDLLKQKLDALKGDE